MVWAEAGGKEGAVDRAETACSFHSPRPEEAGAEAERAGSEDREEAGSATLIPRDAQQLRWPEERFYDCQSSQSIICLIRLLRCSQHGWLTLASRDVLHRGK